MTFEALRRQFRSGFSSLLAELMEQISPIFKKIIKKIMSFLDQLKPLPYQDTD